MKEFNKLDNCFLELKEDCGILNPNETLYRYFNNHQVMPEEDEVIEFIELTENAYKFVKNIV